MLVSIVVLVYNRPELTRQTLDTLARTLGMSDIPYEVIVVDHASDRETKSVLDEYTDLKIVSLSENHGVGHGKNQGVAAARGTHLYISDNDMYFLPGWLEALVEAHETYWEAKVIGAFRHPFHGVYERIDRGGVRFEHSDQQVGSSWFLSKHTWMTYGPLLEDVSYGVDDVFFCNKISADKYWVGSIAPHRLIHCGLHNSDGRNSPGNVYLGATDDLVIDALPEDLIMM